MSDLLNQASLVMVPSGYKEDTVYSVVPSDGSGDLSFTRASNGTRVNSAGLVEICPWNLVTNSENFSANYIDINSTISSNTTTAPNGTTTAESILETTATDVHAIRCDYTETSGIAYTYSVYAKTISGRNIQVLGSNGFTGPIARVNLSNGTLLSGSTGASVESVGNGWYRISITETTTTTSIRVIIYSMDGTATTFAGSTSNGVYIWGAQLNIGSTAKPYFPTTDRLNVPRLTYQNGGGGCPSLLLEKQSTNLVIYSQELDNAAWTQIQSTVTANNTISPDGTQNADKIIPSTVNTYHYVEGSAVTVSNNAMVSIYAKKGQYQRFALRSYITGNNAIFDVNSGTIVGTTNTTASIESVGNGWYRCSLNDTNSTAWGMQIFIMQNTSTSPTDSYSGNGTDGMFFWGAQIEVSSYPTSYIPTTSSSATRVADVATVNLPNTNMTFTAYLELDEASLGTAAGDWFSIYSNVSSLGRAYGYANQFGFADAYSLGVASGAKMVWKQESGSTAKIFKGGALVGTSTTGTYTDPFNRLRIDGALLDKPVKIKQFVFFDNALTDAECIQLTA